MPGGQGDVVEEAKAHAVRRRRMMAGRPDQAQGGAIASGQHGVHRGDTRSRSRQPHLIRRRADHRVRVEIAAACLGRLSNQGRHLGGMNPRDGLGGQWSKGSRLAARGQAGLVKPRVDGLQAGGALRVPAGFVLEEDRIAVEQGHA